MKLALFRTDGSHRLGLGHIMRCLAFAQGLGKIGVKSVFATRDYDQRITEIIRDHGYDVETIPQGWSFAEDASLTSEFVSRYNVDLIVTDLCNQDTMAHLEEYSRHVQALKASDKFMITIDGPVETNFPFDIQIIPYYGAENMNHESHGSAKLLLGPAYFIFRPEFIEAARVRREVKKEAQNLLVTMGGSDPLNVTTRIAEVLMGLNKILLNLRIVIGIGFSDSAKQELENVLQDYGGNYGLIMGSDNMADLMLWSDLSIIAGGLTKYETAVTGTPSIIISQTAHEAAMAEEFEKGGLAIYLGLSSQIGNVDIAKAVENLLDDDVLRTEMARRGRDMVDGRGIRRIIAKIPQEVLS